MISAGPGGPLPAGAASSPPIPNERAGHGAEPDRLQERHEADRGEDSTALALLPVVSAAGLLHALGVAVRSRTEKVPPHSLQRLQGTRNPRRGEGVLAPAR